MAAYAVAHLDEIDELADAGVLYRPVRLELGITAFGATAWMGRAAGDLVVREHDPGDPTADQELFLVMRGHAVFDLDGDRVDAPAGTFVFVRDPAVRRRADTRAAETKVLVVGATPGQPFRPSPWESWLEALPHYEAKDHARAVEVMTRALDEYPDNANVLYNLACCESLAGEHERALEHLLRAAELDEGVSKWAQGDADLDPIRDDPRFPG